MSKESLETNRWKKCFYQKYYFYYSCLNLFYLHTKY